MSDFVHISGIVENLLSTYRRKTDVALSKVRTVWDQIMDREISENARPYAFKGKLLYVRVTSSPYLFQLQYMKPELIQNINTAIGEKVVEDIRFQIGSFQGGHLKG